MKFNKRKEIKRLQTLIDDMFPFLMGNVISGLCAGETSDNEHHPDTCPECEWHQKSLEWEKRIINNELGNQAKKLFIKEYERTKKINEDFALIAPLQGTPEFDQKYEEFHNKWFHNHN